ncbi:MAG: histone deacetylase [Candidatus Babeliales bacterium]|nr:histone deacetylase [Candidatus Babeliales bacterium]
MEKLHPFDSKKYGKVFNSLCKNLNLQKDNFYSPDELDIKDLELVHSKAYLESLNKSKTIAQISEIYPLKFLPNFVLQKFVLTPMKYATSGTVLGAKLALQHGWAINLSGGYHHAKEDSGEGFCFLADIPLAVYKLHEKNPKLKVMVIDLDAHQGNGYESIFKDDKRIANFDVYNGEIYPNDKYAKQFIKYDYPVKSFIKDEEYLNLIRTELPIAIKEFKPDLIIYNAGTDIFSEDPLGRMSVSKEGIIERDSFVFDIAQSNKIPILMVLSGGYSKKSAAIISESVEKIVKTIGY